MAVTREKFVVDKQGKKKEVIIPFEQYERLLEDLHDLAIVAERRKEKSVSIQELKKHLRKDGLL
jgi:hypothetical protein